VPVLAFVHCTITCSVRFFLKKVFFIHMINGSFINLHHGNHCLPLFYKGGIRIVVLNVIIPNHTDFPFAFEHRYGNLTILEFSSKWVKMLPY